MTAVPNVGCNISSLSCKGKLWKLRNNSRFINKLSQFFIVYIFTSNQKLIFVCVVCVYVNVLNDTLYVTNKSQ